MSSTSREKLQALFLKDTACILRAKHMLASCFGFSLLLVVVASFSFRQIGYGQDDLVSVTPGILWMVFLFSGVIALNHSFVSEVENKALVGVVLTRIDPGLIYLSKFAVNFLFVASLQIFAVVMHGLFFGVQMFPVVGEVIGISLLAAIGFSALGTILSSMAVITKGREIVLPLILFPLLVPLVAAAVFLTRGVLQTGAIDTESFWFTLLLVFDVISVVLSWLLFEHVVRDW